MLTLYKMYKMKDYFCMWLQYYSLFFYNSSGHNKTSQQQKILFFFNKKMPSQFLGHLPFTLIATTSVQYGVKEGKKERDWNNDIFLFLYEMYREKCCSIRKANCLLYVWLCGEGNLDMEPVLFASNLLQYQSDVINCMCQFYYSHCKFIIIYNNNRFLVHRSKPLQYYICLLQNIFYRTICF